MTRVDFYILKQKQANARVDFVCKLVEKIYRQGRNVLLHTDNEKQSGILDDLLWTWRQEGFVPHEIQTSDNSRGCPIIINHNPELETQQNDVLVNMASTVPLFFSQFERVTEIIDQDDQAKQLARQRYKFYQERGYPLELHDIS